MSLCRDKTLQTWNLMRGKRAFVINLKKGGWSGGLNGDGGFDGVGGGERVVRAWMMVVEWMVRGVMAGWCGCWWKMKGGA